MNPFNRDDFLWLTSDEASPILEQVQAAFEERTNAVRIAKSLRKTTTPTRSALVMEQAQLRIRARRKFSHADKMFFTRRGLEQASGQRLAEYKARRFTETTNVADICCGIGGDLIALAKRNAESSSGGSVSRTIGVDNDDLTCLFAQKNLEVNGLASGRVQVEHADFADFDLEAMDGLHIDPDRRTHERTVHGNRFSPNLEDVFSEIDSDMSVAIKVAPGTPSELYFPVGLQREWIGDHRECKQQVLWSGPATDKPGHRTATSVAKDGRYSQISIDELELDPTVEVFDSIHRYIFEPHPAVLAAKLTDIVARQHELRRFTTSIAYLTGDDPTEDPLLTQFEVLEVLPLNIRKTVDVLNSLGVGEVEVKKRGIETVTADQFARMKLSGPNFATIILTRLRRTRIVVIAKRKSNKLTMPASDETT